MLARLRQARLLRRRIRCWQAQEANARQRGLTKTAAFYHNLIVGARA